MAVKVEKAENNTVKLELEIPSDEAMKAYNAAVKRIGENVTIAGFRKGKAPRGVVEKYVGIERIKTEALENMLPKVLADALSDNKLDVVTEPYIEKYEFELGKPVKVIAKVELRPEVTLGDYKNMEIAVEKFVTPEDALDKELNALAARFATVKPVIDRETKNTDLVVFDFEGFSGGEVIKNGASKNYMLDLANSNFIPGFAEGLVGHKISEEFEINVKFPADYHDEKMRDADAVFKIKINEIKEKITPAIDDELAKKAGPFKSIEDLKKDITSYLENAQKAENERRSGEAVFTKVVENAKVDIQDTMINREAHMLMNDLRQRYEQQNVPWDKILESQGQDKIFEQMREEAKSRIKNSLVIEKIAKEEDIKVETGDFQEHIREIAQSYKTDEQNILEQMKKNPSLINAISQQIISKKIAKFLQDNNTFKYEEKTKG